MTHSRSPDESAFVDLYEREYGDVLRFLQRRTHPDHAEDAAAEAFLVAWRRFDEMPQAPESARAWLFGIARHVVLNQRRGRQRQQALGVRLATHPSEHAAQDGSASSVLLADLQRVWPRLSEVHQEALSLAIFEDLDAAAAGAVLGISPVAYRLRLSRARRALRAHLQLTPDTVLTVAGASERTVTP